MAKKDPRILENAAGGYDLLVERDAGNEVLIFTGRKENSRKFWRRMLELSKMALDEINGISS